MDERVVQFRVGVMVLATGIITAVLIVLFGKLPTLVRGTYTVNVQFQDASGVAADTPVRESGILVGRVAKTELNDQGVLVTLRIHSDVKLTKRESVRVATPLLGDTVLQIVKNYNPMEPAAEITDGEYMTGASAPDVFKIAEKLEGKMDATILSLGNAGDEVAHLAHNVNRLLENNDEQFNRIIVKAERSLDSFQRAMTSIDDLVSDPQTRADLKKSIAALPKLLDDTEQTVSSVQTAVLAAKDTIDSANRNLKNFEGLTEPLNKSGPTIIKNMDQGVAHLEGLLNELEVFTKNLNQSDGTLSQLVNNPELYQNLNSAALNVKELTREAKPIVRDVRVLSDELARHPSLIITDLFGKKSGIKGVSPVGYWDLERGELIDCDPPK